MLSFLLFAGAVLAMIQKSDTSISKGMETKIAGESLFNDGIGVVIFLTILSVAEGGVGSVSAPLAMVVMGIFVGNSGRPDYMAEVAGSYVHKFWHVVDEALNAILFLLIGLEVLIIPWTVDYVIFGIVAIFIVLLGRFLGVGVPISIMRTLRSFERGTIRMLTWGGLRGGISVALALSLPDVAVKELFVTATYSVVVFAIIVQGLTVSPLFEKVIQGETAQPQGAS